MNLHSFQNSVYDFHVSSWMDLLIIQWSEIATTVSTHAPKLVLDKIRKKIDDSLCIPHAAVIKYTRTAIVSTGGSSLCNNKSNGPFYTPATVYSSPPRTFACGRGCNFRYGVFSTAEKQGWVYASIRLFGHVMVILEDIRLRKENCTIKTVKPTLKLRID